MRSISAVRRFLTRAMASGIRAFSSALEQTEQLEQLRLLAAGVHIRAFEVAPTGPGVDTPACLEAVRALLAGGQGALRELADAILEAQGKAAVFQSATGFNRVAAGMAQ
ncbi:hypothetical protein [Thiorhodovibrio frisius]|uniref:hypothetical protein n=1 Tax=Thiorhodovibrio frisius TaxID=631362 RepID=UPI0028BE071D|nr:hypothetical protein [Thiorhodovibrio frisius]